MSKLTAKRRAAEDRLSAAKAKLTEDDRAEIEERAELSKLEEEAKAEEERARNLDMQRRLEAAEEKNPGKRFASVAIEGFSDTFIVMADAQAHIKWENELSKSAQNKNADRNAIHRAYAQTVIYDWNGNLRDGDPEITIKLVKLLTDNPGIVNPLTEAALRLVGAVAAERKS